jgi:hypothetical protein
MKSLLLSLLFVFAAFGPSAAQIEKARTTEYRADAVEAILAGIRETMREERYDIELDDPQRGVIVSTWRWYTKEGMAKQRGSAVIEDGACLFRMGVELGKGPRGGIIIHVDGGAQLHKGENVVGQPMAHGDADEPPWVAGKIDNLTVAIHAKLAQYQLPSTP